MTFIARFQETYSMLEPLTALYDRETRIHIHSDKAPKLPRICGWAGGYTTYTMAIGLTGIYG